MVSKWCARCPLYFTVRFLVNVLLFYPFNSTVSDIYLSQFFIQTSKDNLTEEMFIARELFFFFLS